MTELNDNNNVTATSGTEGSTPSAPSTPSASEGNTVAQTTKPAGDMTDGIVENNEGKDVIPEGFDADIFDTETMTLKQDKVAERLKSLKEESEKYKKQAVDMRRKLSKGVDTPATKEEYAEGYALDSKYDEALADKDSPVSKYVDASLKNFDNIAMENGFTLQQANIVKDLFMKVMEEVSIIDTRSDEVKEAERAKFIEQQRKLLGDDADKIIRQNADWVANYNFFDKGEKQVLSDMIKGSATGNMIVAKIRKLFGQNEIEIPATVSADGLADDVTLAKEYNRPDTTPQRRQEIIKQRIAAGRTGNLPTV